MIFPSVSFLFLFFPVFLLAYLLLPWKNGVILLTSLFFYFWGEGYYLFLLLGTVVFTYSFGLLVAHKNQKYSRLGLFLGVSFNLLILFYYKYFGFFVVSVLHMHVETETIPALPLGISFFIFQAISYLVDVYRRDAEKAASLFDLSLYITMFPQLIAGPIVRYSAIAVSIRCRTVDVLMVRDGALLFIGGMCQKVLIANGMGEVADTVFAYDLSQITPSIAWLGSITYTLQIYYDFAGYSNMAIGLGLIMGFQFPVNFNYPYISKSISEFWRRWHISLSSWFRDYLYIPLGGNKKGVLRTYYNLFVVFLLCGLWHGASWTFVAWGTYHGCLLILERSVLKNILSAIPAGFSNLYALIVIIVGWVLFRSDTFEQAIVFILALFGESSATQASSFQELLSHKNLTVLLAGIVFSTPVIPFLLTKLNIMPSRSNHQQFGWLGSKTIIVMALLGFILCSIQILSGTYNPFIYFRF